MKKTPLKRGTKMMKRTPFKVSRKKRATWQIGGNKRKIRSKLPTLKKLRDLCDRLLTPIIKKMYPVSIFSGQPTEVAHHHIKKSESNACRYYLPNLVPLTNAEHQRLHARESYWSSKVVEHYGMDWWKDLDAKKKEYTKVDRLYYVTNLARLQEIHDQLYDT